MIEPEHIESAIKTALPNAEIFVSSRDGVHYYAEVTAEAFVGKTLIEQHRMILDVLKTQISKDEFHAISIKTFKPDSPRSALSDKA